jgi:hypothetical protein
MSFINADAAGSKLHRWLINRCKENKYPWARRAPGATTAVYEVDLNAIIAAILKIS